MRRSLNFSQRALLGAGLLSMVILGGACDDGPGGGEIELFLLGIDDQASGSLDGAGFDQEQAREMLLAGLASAENLSIVADRKPEAYLTELVIGIASERQSDVDGEIGTYRAVQVELLLKRRGAGDMERLSAQGKAFLVQDEEVGRQEGFERVLKLSINRAIQNIELQLETRSYSVDKLRQKLSSKRSEERLYVLRSLRERPMPSLVPDVIRLLRDSDDEVVLEAVGVLVAQGDRRAVVPLIRMSQTRDPVFQLQLVTAVAELGGQVARGYLFTLAAGHSSSEIRKRASEGLARVKVESKKAAGSVAMPDGDRPHEGVPK